MKRILTVAAIVAASFTATAHAADVGVSVSIGQPGFYGQIDIAAIRVPRSSTVSRFWSSAFRSVARRFICASRLVTPNTGASTAMNTAPAVSGSILSRTAGTNANTCRAISSAVVVNVIAALLTALDPIVDALDDSMLGNLTRTELKQLIHLLDRIRAAHA